MPTSRRPLGSPEAENRVIEGFGSDAPLLDGPLLHCGAWLRLCALDTGSGALAWGANPNGSIHALALDGETRFAGGQFSRIGDQAAGSGRAPTRSERVQLAPGRLPDPVGSSGSRGDAEVDDPAVSGSPPRLPAAGPTRG